MSIGAAIAQERERANLTQDDLAQRLGISRSAVAQWETGRAEPTATHLRRLSIVLNVSIDSLFLSTPTPEINPMAFAIRNLSVLAYAQGFTLWHYRANVPTLGASMVPAGTFAEICSPGFFQPAEDMLAAGDMILVSARDTCGVLFVAQVEGGIVTAPLGQPAAPAMQMAAE